MALRNGHEGGLMPFLESPEDVEFYLMKQGEVYNFAKKGGRMYTSLRSVPLTQSGQPCLQSPPLVLPNQKVLTCPTKPLLVEVGGETALFV